MEKTSGLLDRFRSFGAIVLLSVVAAVIYGIVHDQITVRICLEYFTVGHPLIFGNQSPTVLAILWGIVATWWMGLFLGIILALASTLGSNPVITARSLVRPLLRLLAVMAVSAAIAGAIGFGLTSSTYMADAFAHEASYAVGFLGGLALAIKTWIVRVRQAKTDKISTL